MARMTPIEKLVREIGLVGCIAPMRDCPHCGSKKIYQLRKWSVFRCAGCGRDFSATSGGPLHSRKMPLEKYEIAFEQFQKGATAMSVAKLIGCNYRSAWRLRQIAIQMVRNGHA